jgi:tRNA A-37 threonylcarbamoyl transferase component Bud32
MTDQLDTAIAEETGAGSDAGSTAHAAFPRLRLRSEATELFDLPWDRPLADWPDEAHHFLTLPVGPSRHLVRFLEVSGATFALKEEPLDVARREFDVLRHMEDEGLPAVSAVGLAEAPDRDTGILVTQYLAHSLQYRRLLMRVPLEPGAYRDRLLDAMAWLLVDLHRGGVYWGDCSLANTLFRRDGNKMQAYLVDAETSEVHPSLSDGQRAYDLEILLENVAFGLADLAELQGRTDGDEAIAAAESVRDRYEMLWLKLHEEPDLQPGDRQAVRARIRKLNDLGFSVDEIKVRPAGSGDRLRMQLAVTTRRFHARELEKRTGIVALENQARLLLNDLSEYGAWLCWYEQRSLDPETIAARWLREVYEPTLARIATVVGPDRDVVQAYCDLLEHKWLLSEKAGRDVGMAAAMDAYLALGAPAPEVAG